MDEDCSDVDIYGDLDDPLAADHELFQHGTERSDDAAHFGSGKTDDSGSGSSQSLNDLLIIEENYEKALNESEKFAKSIVELESKMVVMKRENSILKANISSLYKTAKAEIDRKNNEISELRRELDVIIFRRNFRGDKTNFNFLSKSDADDGSDAHVGMEEEKIGKIGSSLLVKTCPKTSELSSFNKEAEKVKQRSPSSSVDGAMVVCQSHKEREKNPQKDSIAAQISTVASLPESGENDVGGQESEKADFNNSKRSTLVLIPSENCLKQRKSFSNRNQVHSNHIFSELVVKRHKEKHGLFHSRDHRELYKEKSRYHRDHHHHQRGNSRETLHYSSRKSYSKH